MIYTAFDHYMFSAHALRGSIALYHTSHFRLPYLRKRLNLREDFSNATPERSSERLTKNEGALHAAAGRLRCCSGGARTRPCSARGGTRIKWGAGSSQCSRRRRSCCRHVYKTGKLVDKVGHPAGVRCEQGSRAEERAQQRVEWRSAGTGRVPRRATHADTDSEDSLAGTTSEHWWCISSIIFFTNGHWRRFAAIARAQVASAAATPQRIASAATQPAGEVWTHPRCSHPTGQPSSCAVAHERGAVERPVDAHASRRGRGCSEVSCARGEQC